MKMRTCSGFRDKVDNLKAAEENEYCVCFGILKGNYMDYFFLVKIPLMFKIKIALESCFGNF